MKNLYRLKPDYLKATYTDFRRVWKKSKSYKFVKKYPELAKILIVLIFGLGFVFISKVYASPEISEIGISRPERVNIKHFKSPKYKKIITYTIQPVAKPQEASNVSGDVWYKLRLCESGNDYQKNTGNGYYGAYQFSYSTWQSMGTGYERADLAPPQVQDSSAKRLQAQSGWGQWPHCSSKLGLR